MPDTGPAAGIPLGPLPGKANILSSYDSLGKIRPFGPREFLHNPDGSWSSEMTATVQMPGGAWSVVPTLWLVNGVPHRVDEDTATEYAQQSGLIWPQFATEMAAEDFATQRESRWQQVEHGRSDMQPPLWTRRWPPR